MGDVFSNIDNSTIITVPSGGAVSKDRRAVVAAAKRMARLHNAPDENDDTVWSSLTGPVRARWRVAASQVLEAVEEAC